MPKKRSLTLTKQELDAALKKYDGWSVSAKGTQLVKSFAFRNFVEGLVFVARIAVHAEVLGHHPDIELSYGKVKVRLTTHELKQLTKVDLVLLERIESISMNGA